VEGPRYCLRLESGFGMIPVARLGKRKCSGFIGLLILADLNLYIGEANGIRRICLKVG
jgi:hypothetical protein